MIIIIHKSTTSIIIIIPVSIVVVLTRIQSIERETGKRNNKNHFEPDKGVGVKYEKKMISNRLNKKQRYTIHFHILYSYSY